MPSPASKLDALRAGRSELENHYLDELAAGRIGRREFMRKGAVIGMSSTLVGAALSACGGANSSNASSATSSGAAAADEGRHAPTRLPGPVRGGQPDHDRGPGWLHDAHPDRRLPHLRQQHDPAAAADAGDQLEPQRRRVGMDVQAAPGGQIPQRPADERRRRRLHVSSSRPIRRTPSSALSTFAGVLKPEGVVKVDSETVAFHLEGPNGNFPYIISSDNYNLIIVPEGHRLREVAADIHRNRAVQAAEIHPEPGRPVRCQPRLLGGPPHLAGTAFQFYAGQPPQILALQGGQVDVVAQFTAQGAEGLLNNSNYDIIKVKSASHRELSMRNDMAPFTDPRVRQAIALTLDRPAMVQALLQGDGQVGNDSPFAPKFASTNTSVPQRVQDLAKAKALLTAAGHPDGFSTTLTAGEQEEIPQLRR